MYYVALLEISFIFCYQYALNKILSTTYDTSHNMIYPLEVCALILLSWKRDTTAKCLLNTPTKCLVFQVS